MEGGAGGAAGGARGQEAAQDRWLPRPLAELRKAADNGDSAAQLVLGNSYDFGVNGLSKSPKLSAEWYTKAAAQGNANAQNNLGSMCGRGVGVARNEVEALRLYRLAAKQGLAPSMCNLAEYLDLGKGCEKNPVLAVLWMKRAAELGDASAQGQLGALYGQREGCPLPINYKEALRMSRLSADQENLLAMCNLGGIYENGQGVPRDLDGGCRLYRKAIALGHEPAKNYLRYLVHIGHAPSLAALCELGLAPR